MASAESGVRRTGKRVAARSERPPQVYPGGMPSEQLTADDLLSLCARTHGAAGRLDASPPSPRLQTLRKLSRFVNDRMTAAALAHERDAVSIEVVHGLQDAVQALVFADLLSQIGVAAGGYIRLDRDGMRPAIAPTPAERGLHAGFLEQVDGVSAALFVVADELLEVAYASQTTLDPETADADDAVQMLATPAPHTCARRTPARCPRSRSSASAAWFG